MRSNFRQFRRNAGLFNGLRIAVGGLLLLVLCVSLLVCKGQPAPLIGLVVCAALPFFVREALIDRLEASFRASRSFRIALVGMAVALGAARDHLPFLDGGICTTLFLAAAALYLGLYVVLYSDIRVEVQR